MVGNLYDVFEYSVKCDIVFSLFYMVINIGVLFVLIVVIVMINYVLGKVGFSYVFQIFFLVYQFLDGMIIVEGEVILIVMQIVQNFIGSMVDFCIIYIDKLFEVYNYGFGVVCILLVVFMVIYVIFCFIFKYVDYNFKQVKLVNVYEEELIFVQIKECIVVLLLVFVVVIFFWMVFYQNGFIMIFFVCDYMVYEVIGLDCFGFSVWNLVLFIVIVYVGFLLFQFKIGKGKLILGVIVILVFVVLGVNYGIMDFILFIFFQIF